MNRDEDMLVALPGELKDCDDDLSIDGESLTLAERHRLINISWRSGSGGS
jgi:hypothetical protein